MAVGQVARLPLPGLAEADLGQGGVDADGDLVLAQGQAIAEPGEEASLRRQGDVLVTGWRSRVLVGPADR